VHRIGANLQPIDERRHLLDCKPLAGDATAAILDIHERGKGAIVVGGTGFYVRALTGGIELAAQYDERLRARLAHEAQVHPAEFLHEWLQQRDSKRAAALDLNDTYRVLRALEVALASPEAVQRECELQTLVTAKIPFRKLFLDVPLAELDERIERRTASMISSGLLDEAERIGTDAVAATAVGYPQALAYLSGWSTAEELQASLARATRRYARRQRSWFRTESGVKWADRAGVEAAARENFGAA